MRKIIFTIVSAIGLLLLLMAQAQGTLYVSNLGQTPTGSATVGSDSWLAQPFATGTNAGGYVLNSVQLLMDAASGSPSGFTVSIYNQSSSAPFFPPMNGVGSLSGSDPSTGGIFTYTASSFTLSPSTLYFVVVTAATPVAQGAYDWSAVFGATGQGSQWIIEPGYYSSADGLSWQMSRQYAFQLAIYATELPEPATLALAGLGLAALSFWRRRQGK
jgi:hypothetical protein